MSETVRIDELIPMHLSETAEIGRIIRFLAAVQKIHASTVFKLG